MVNRRISAKFYVGAGILTVFIFATGLGLGAFLGDHRTEFLEQWQRVQKADLERFQVLLRESASAPSAEKCTVAQSILHRNVEDMGIATKKVDRYLLSPLAQYNSRLLRLKHEYMISAMRAWGLAGQIGKVCGFHNVHVLFLYSEHDCDECFFQAKVLEYVKDRYEHRLLIFGVDADTVGVEEIDQIKESYAVKRTPTLIIGKSKYEGLLTTGQLQDILREHYSTHASLLPSLPTQYPEEP